MNGPSGQRMNPFKDSYRLDSRPITFSNDEDLPTKTISRFLEPSQIDFEISSNTNRRLEEEFKEG